MYRKKHIGSVLFAISHILWNIFLRISRDYWIPFYLVFPGEMVVMAIEINLGGEGMGLKEARLFHGCFLYPSKCVVLSHLVMLVDITVHFHYSFIN